MIKILNRSFVNLMGIFTLTSFVLFVCWHNIVTEDFDYSLGLFKSIDYYFPFFLISLILLPFLYILNKKLTILKFIPIIFFIVTFSLMYFPHWGVVYNSFSDLMFDVFNIKLMDPLKFKEYLPYHEFYIILILFFVMLVGYSFKKKNPNKFKIYKENITHYINIYTYRIYILASISGLVIIFFGSINMLSNVADKIINKENGKQNIILYVLDGVSNYELDDYDTFIKENNFDKYQQNFANANGTSAYFGVLYTGNVSHYGKHIKYFLDKNLELIISQRDKRSKNNLTRSDLILHNDSMIEAILDDDVRINITGHLKTFPHNTTARMNVESILIQNLKKSYVSDLFFDYTNIFSSFTLFYDNTDKFFPYIKQYKNFKRILETNLRYNWTSYITKRNKFLNIVYAATMKSTSKNSDKGPNCYYYEDLKNLKASSFRNFYETNEKNLKIGENARALNKKCFFKYLNFIKYIKNINDKYNENNINSVFIFTGDHGEAVQNGRLSHVYHADLQSIHTPLLIYNNDGVSKTYDQIVDVVDLSSKIRSFYLNNEKPDSFIITNERKYVNVLINPYPPLPPISEENKKSFDYSKIFFYLVHIDKSKKLRYQMNIHPRGNAESLSLELNDETETPLQSWVGRPGDFSKEKMLSIMSDLSLDKTLVHKAFWE